MPINNTIARPMHASEIPWSLPPAPAVEAPDLESFAVETATDAATYRELLLEALAAVAHVTHERDRLRARYRALLEQDRALQAGRAA